MSQDLELIHSQETPIYHRMPSEPLDAYEAFSEWCRVPMSSRTLGNFLRRTAYPQKLIRKLMVEWHWEVRASAFDHDSLQLRPDPHSMDEEAALAGQMVAASTLIDLGMRALEIKNISQLSADKALKILEKGVEIQRRALGVADINVNFSSEDLGRLNKLMDDLGLGDMDIEDAIIIPDEPETIPIEEDEAHA